MGISVVVADQVIEGAGEDPGTPESDRRRKTARVIAGRFEAPLRDIAALAEQMVRLCPDLVDGEEIRSSADLAAGLEAEHSFLLWWG